jgi:hypothetical protein
MTGPSALRGLRIWPDGGGGTIWIILSVTRMTRKNISANS